MKNDPYGKLGGLDQLLFKGSPGPTTKRRNNETTLPRNDDGSSDRGREDPRHRNIEATRRRAILRSTQHPNLRIDERHSHDLFHDQVRWMNRAKLDIEETHGKRVTSNAIVQLAIDLLIHDYNANGDASSLIRMLVHDESMRGEGS